MDCRISELEVTINNLIKAAIEEGKKSGDYSRFSKEIEKLRELRDSLIKEERSKYGNLAPEIRYIKDVYFKHLVDMMELMIHKAQFTPSELREAAILAAIHYSTKQKEPFYS